VREAFQAKVENGTFLGARGRFKFQGVVYRCQDVAWALHVGRWPPKGFKAVARGGDPACVDPERLRLVRIKGYLSQEQKWAIIRLRARGYTFKELAGWFGVSVPTIEKVVKRDSCAFPSIFGSLAIRYGVNTKDRKVYDENFSIEKKQVKSIEEELKGVSDRLYLERIEGSWDVLVDDGPGGQKK